MGDFTVFFWLVGKGHQFIIKFCLLRCGLEAASSRTPEHRLNPLLHHGHVMRGDNTCKLNTGVTGRGDAAGYKNTDGYSPWTPVLSVLDI